MADTWATIEGVKKWIDEGTDLDPQTALLVRVAKIGEELGEANQALIGEMGVNPRKGKSHTREDVKKELADVILTAMVALATADDTPGEFFDQHLAGVAERVGIAV